MRFCASLISIAMIALAGCGPRQAPGYAFAIRHVTVTPAYQSLDIHLEQDLELSQQAREALEHGVTLTVRLDLELRDDSHMIAARRDTRRFQLRYLPLSERYQFAQEETGAQEAFTRLRHMLAAMDDLSIHFSTGPLPPGSYELRTRISLDESRLPTPMQLPAWFSPQWRHDSEWSTWPFKVNA